MREYMNIEEVVAIVEAVPQPVGFRGRLGYADFPNDALSFTLMDENQILLRGFFYRVLR